MSRLDLQIWVDYCVWVLYSDVFPGCGLVVC